MSNPHTLCPICHTSNRSDARFCQKCGKNIWLNDKYRITRSIKEGGMGAVYEAIDGNGKRYALKALIDRFTDPGERQEAIARFQEEAELLSDLKHPQIPRVYDHFEHGGRYYLAMDFVDGIDLEDLQKQQPNQRFSEKQVLLWAIQIADVLDYLHSKRLIYRDVKPSNIMIENGTGNVKVVDFGIAKLFQPHQRGTLIGTPGYSPPEQYQGQAEPRSDVFALGATLHHLLTGRDPRDNPPFSFPKLRTLVPAISFETEAAITKALQMEIDERFQSAGAFKAALPTERATRTKKPKPQPTVMLDPGDFAGQAAKPQAKPQAKSGQATAKSKPNSQPVAPPAPRKRAWWPVWIFLGALLLIALGSPVVSEQITSFFNGAPPQPTTIPGPTAIIPTLTPQGTRLSKTYETTVEVTVPAGSSDDVIRENFTQRYLELAQQEFGNTAQIIRNRPLSYIGNPQPLNESDTEITYSVVMNGWVNYYQP